MKITIIYAAFVAALSVEAFAVAGQDECFADGGPCSALKRAVEAVARYSLHDRQSHHHHQCWTDGAMCFKEKREVCGSSCLKAKRDALALTKAVAEAAPFTNLDRQQCNSKEGHCSKAKRNAAEAAEALAAAEAHHDSSARDDVETNGVIVQRAAKAAAEALARNSDHHQCWVAGAMCFKAKRARDGFNEVINSII